MRRSVIVSRFSLTLDELVKAGAMFQNYSALVSKSEGFLATSVWRSVADQDQFLRITTFASIDSYLKAYNEMVESGGLETAVLRYGVLPDVLISEVVWRHGRAIEEVLDQEYVSLSDRKMSSKDDADAWIHKLKSNLRECDAIPGFDGAILSQGYEMKQRVLGLALWRSERAFRESVPHMPDYTVHFYQRVK